MQPPKQISRFRIDQELGSGSAGTAYLGTDVESGDKVAIKLLSTAMSNDETMQKRFLREMQVMSKLAHPGIVKLYECGLHDDKFYYVMEWIDFGTLKTILMARTSIPWREATEVALQIAEGLAHAHENGVVHRDLKPANVFISTDGRVLLGDFGLAKDASAASLTADGLTVGTCQYMSPEQIQGRRDISGAADLYALGCLIYEMITGQLPYVSLNVVELLQMHIGAPPPDLKKVAPRCPQELATLVQQLMAKAPADRPASAREVADQLRGILQEDTAGRAPAPAGKETPVAPAPGQASPEFFDRLTGRSQRAASWKVLAVILIAAAVIGTLVALNAGRGGGAKETESSKQASQQE
jgi:serine/threonine protein kinase